MVLTRVCVGLWKAWFLPLMKGEHCPSAPKVPPEMHMQNRVQVPYTPEEMKDRTQKYEDKKKTHDKTMKVHTNAFFSRRITPISYHNETACYEMNSTQLVHYCIT